MPAWFNVKKAAQVVAFFARQQGGEINVLKLMKLVYIADRVNIELHDFPITGDQLVSMDNGPVNSVTLNLVNGMSDEKEDWETYVSDRSGHFVGLRRDVTDDQLDQLSRVELATLHRVWNEFGAMGRYQIRDWTHLNCPEWVDPNGSSQAISYRRLFEVLGKADPAALALEVESDRALRTALTRN